jgi:DNA-directed RNA polymerase specialized sigma24 family protein
LKKDRKAQKELYQVYFGHALKICLRYAGDREEALEFFNDGFMKVFTKLQLYQPNYACKTG